MTGFIKVEALENGGISVETRLHDVSMIEKAHIVSGVLQGLEIDLNDHNEVAMLTALACLVGKSATNVWVDGNLVEALKKLSEEKEKGVE